MTDFWVTVWRLYATLQDPNLISTSRHSMTLMTSRFNDTYSNSSNGRNQTGFPCLNRPVFSCARHASNEKVSSCVRPGGHL